MRTGVHKRLLCKYDGLVGLLAATSTRLYAVVSKIYDYEIFVMDFYQSR
jgi:hypothetical protein